MAQNYIQAYMWYTLAADQGTDDLAAKFQNGLKKSMTPAQLAEAQRLVREWKVKGKEWPGACVPEELWGSQEVT